jgi:hypothetical protein
MFGRSRLRDRPGASRNPTFVKIVSLLAYDFMLKGLNGIELDTEDSLARY